MCRLEEERVHRREKCDLIKYMPKSRAFVDPRYTAEGWPQSEIFMGFGILNNAVLESIDSLT